MENLVDEILKQHAFSKGRVIEENGNKIGIISQIHFSDNLQNLFDKNVIQTTPVKSIKIMPSLLGSQSNIFQISQDNISEQLDSVVFIQAENKNGEVKGYGSGFIVSFDGHIITCCHVVDSSETLRIRLKIKGHIFWCNAKIVNMQRICDLALLKIEGYNYPPLTLGSKNPDLGQELILLGYPFGKRLSDDIDKLNPSFFSGNVSSINSKNGYDRIYVNVEAKSGCSGAPVISEDDGKVIGILRGSIIDQRKNLTEEFNYIIPVKYIWQYFVEIKQ